MKWYELYVLNIVRTTGKGYGTVEWHHLLFRVDAVDGEYEVSLIFFCVGRFSTTVYGGALGPATGNAAEAPQPLPLQSINLGKAFSRFRSKWHLTRKPFPRSVHLHFFCFFKSGEGTSEESEKGRSLTRESWDESGPYEMARVYFRRQSIKSFSNEPMEADLTSRWRGTFRPFRTCNKHFSDKDNPRGVINAKVLAKLRGSGGITLANQ